MDALEDTILKLEGKKVPCHFVMSNNDFLGLEKILVTHMAKAMV